MHYFLGTKNNFNHNDLMNEDVIIQISTYTPTRISVDWIAACLRFQISRHALCFSQFPVLQVHQCYPTKKEILTPRHFYTWFRPQYLDVVIWLRKIHKKNIASQLLQTRKTKQNTQCVQPGTKKKQNLALGRTDALWRSLRNYFFLGCFLYLHPF